jgi:RNA polymerase sigma factor (TIGR02999 family)
MTPGPGQVTRLLAAVRAGDPGATSELIPIVYGELRQIAGAYFRHERPGHTLQPTALVHEAWIRLMANQDTEWKNRAQFFGIASKLMRRIQKGGGGRKQTSLDVLVAQAAGTSHEFLDVDRALTQLNAIDPSLAQLVELRFFAGLSVDEAAEFLGIAPRTAARQWRLAQAWLRRHLGPAQ